MRSIAEDLWFHDGDYASSLAGGRIPSQHVGILCDGQGAWGVGPNLEDAAPLGELAAVRLVLATPHVQVV